MPIMFNTLLSAAGFPLPEVRLVRHKDNRADRGRSPYELWRDDRPKFEGYQSVQGFHNRVKLSAPFWAVFIVNLQEETMFAGMYRAAYRGLLKKDTPWPTAEGGMDLAGSCDVFDLTPDDRLADLSGRMFINWGAAALAWVQHAKRNDKPVIEVRPAFREEDFPGFLNFIQPLSKLGKLPKSWETALRSCRGVYLLTCPKTKEQYVGSASGEDGFWGRWQSYLQTGHGGNVGLKSRDPSDYQVSVLEVAGTSATEKDILAMEGLWQSKLQSMGMGLNKNWAGAK